MKILHFIDSLNFGGAENLLMSYIPMLGDHEHFVVTLNGPNLYERANYEYVNLNARPVRGFLKATIATRKLIAEKKIDIVHSHSYWTNIISRLATGKKVKLINHYHFADYETMRTKAAVKKMILLDRLTNRRKMTRVAVSEYMASILRNTFPTSQIKVIANFIECKQNEKNTLSERPGLKVVAIGNCNLEKNWPTVLEAFGQLREEPVSLDIMGGGDRLDFYRGEAKRMGLENVRFLGVVPNAKQYLVNYDLFLSASISETFGLAILESICARLPLLISDIPPFREIASNCAQFFNPHDRDGLVKKLKEHLHEQRQVDAFEYSKVLDKYSAQTFLFELRHLYNN